MLAWNILMSRGSLFTKKTRLTSSVNIFPKTYILETLFTEVICEIKANPIRLGNSTDNRVISVGVELGVAMVAITHPAS